MSQNKKNSPYSTGLREQLIKRYPLKDIRKVTFLGLEACKWCSQALPRAACSPILGISIYFLYVFLGFIWFFLEFWLLLSIYRCWWKKLVFSGNGAFTLEAQHVLWREAQLCSSIKTPNVLSEKEKRTLCFYEQPNLYFHEKHICVFQKKEKHNLYLAKRKNHSLYFRKKQNYAFRKVKSTTVLLEKEKFAACASTRKQSLCSWNVLP